MSTRREDKSSDKQRFSSDDADARQEGGSSDQRTAEQEAFRAPPKVAPKFAREYVGTESPAARLMRLAQGLAGKRSEQAKRPPADDQRSAPPPHSAPPKFNPKFAKEFIGTPPPRAEQASSSAPPPPPKPPNTPPPFDPRFSSEYVGNRSPFAAKGKAAAAAAPPPPPPPPPAPSVPPPKVDAKYAKETIVRPSPFAAAGASAKPAPKPAKPASAQARPTAKAASGAKPPPPPRQAPPPRPPAASVPPPKVEAKYAKESVGTPSPFTTGGASAKPAPKPSKPSSAQTRPVAKTAAAPKPAAAKPAAAAPTASSQQSKARASANWRESKSSGRAFDVPLGQTVKLEQFVASLFAYLERPSAVLLIDRYVAAQEPRLQVLAAEMQRQAPGLRLTVWTRISKKRASELSQRLIGAPPASVRSLSEIPGFGKLHARHLVVAHKAGWRVWLLDNSLLGLIEQSESRNVAVSGDVNVMEKSVDKLPRIAFLETEYESALI